jgi:hypothetical protein
MSILVDQATTAIITEVITTTLVAPTEYSTTIHLVEVMHHLATHHQAPAELHQ